ncbi:hypothetical protein M9Y10_014203 [Tritrichomonas musculus]|uniref:C2 NT-type domain-containing protein n=1 Tax=Tritrichomonas musculus TaxID=1915356 RepID=A0ABR2KYV4_9EUKA
MSHSKSLRQKFICTFIIQSFRVFENFDNSFYAVWEFGKENGTTEYRFCNNDGVIELDKNYEFQCGNSKTKAHKHLKIEVFRNAKKTKCIGKLKLDVSNYLNGEDALSQTITMKPNGEEKPPEITISFFSNLDINTLGEQTEDDIQSIIEVTQELATISSRHKVSRTAYSRKSVDLTPRLSDMKTISDQKSDDDRDKVDDKEKKKEIRERRKTARTDSLKSISSFLSPSTKTISRSSSTFTSPHLEHEKTPIYDVIGDCLGNFDHLLSQKIDFTDKHCRSFEGPDSFIFAQCLADKLFDELDENSFQKIMTLLPAEILKSPILSTYNDDRRRFFPLYGLSAMLYKPPSKYELNKTRTLQLFNTLQGTTCKRLKILIDCYVNIFEVQVKGIIEHRADPEKTIDDFTRLFDAYLIACQSPKEFESILTRAIISAVDLMFMRKLFKRKNITFIDTLHWNSFCTCFGENSSFKLTNFSEAVKVLQMVNLIDTDNNEISNICKDLPPMCIMQLLKLRAVDDTINKAPDIEKFAETYGLDPSIDDFDIDTLIDWNKLLRQSYKSVNTDNWTDVNMPTRFRLEFLTIASYFNE